MHILVAVLGALATVLFLLSRIGKGASDLAETAQELSNLPRRLRHRRKAGKQGLDLIENPVEAATVLMIAVARMDGLGRVSDTQASHIAKQLSEHMQLSPEDADGYVVQLRSLSGYLKQADSALFPMVDLLQTFVTKEEARDLSTMLVSVAESDDPPNPEQLNFIRRFEERMGLGS